MPDTNGAAARRWRSGIPARFTALAAALFVLLSGLLIAAAAHGVRASATDRAAQAAVSAIAGAAGDLARGDDPVDVLASLHARSDVVEAYLLARDGALLAGVKPVEGAASAGEPSAQADAAMTAVTIGDDAAYAFRTIPLPGGAHGALHVAVSLAEVATETARVVAGGLLATLAFLAFALPAFGLVVDRTMAPLRALARAAGRDGDVPADLMAAAERGDEIGVLARAHLAMTRRLSQNDDVVRRLTFDDPLTRLPNREALSRRLADGLRIGEAAALLKIGVNGIGRVATGLGQSAHDLAVRGAADRLRQAAVEWSRGDHPGGPLWNDRAVFLARTGEAEFALLAERATAESGEELARRALAAFAEPLMVDDHPVTLGLAIGLAFAPVHGDEAQVLMRSAGTALAIARTAGGGQAIRVAGVDLNDNAYGRLRIEQELRRAIPNGELEVHYQPQIELRTGRVTGAEALVRWRHPTRGLIPPDRFIPVAEETGLVEPLGRFVLDEASRKAAAWAEMGLHARIAVNVSALQFRNPRFAETTLAIIRGAGCDPDLIELEITESMAMADADHAARELGPLRAAGVRIAIDDFGTGYSNLASLTQLPFDVLKIDRGFVRDALQKPNARVVVAAVLGLASALGVETVAEGVETEDQRAFVAGHGCTFGQGYLFARPMPADAFEAWRQARLAADLRALHERALAGGRAAAASFAG